jgi:hypothetical protein
MFRRFTAVLKKTRGKAQHGVIFTEKFVLIATIQGTVKGLQKHNPE